MPEIDPKTLEDLAESIAFHAAGMATGTGHLAEFRAQNSEELRKHIKKLLGDPESKFFINHSNNAQRGVPVYI